MKVSRGVEVGGRGSEGVGIVCMPVCKAMPSMLLSCTGMIYFYFIYLFIYPGASNLAGLV